MLSGFLVFGSGFRVCMADHFFRSRGKTDMLRTLCRWALSTADLTQVRVDCHSSVHSVMRGV